MEQIQPLVQDALDSIEFITGSPDSRWGAARAAMGHPAPWALTYMAIGNEVFPSFLCKCIDSPALLTPRCNPELCGSVSPCTCV